MRPTVNTADAKEMPLIMAMGFLLAVIWLSATMGSVALWGAKTLLLMFPILFLVTGMAPLGAFTIGMLTLVWQNAFISLFAPGMADVAYFSIQQGISFFTVACFAGLATVDIWRERASLDAAQKRLMVFVFGVLGILVAYIVLGMIAPAGGLKNAIVYFRNIGGAWLLLLAGYYFGKNNRQVDIKAVIGIVLAAAVIYGWAELLMTEVVYDLLNVADFFSLKWLGRDLSLNTSALITFMTRNFFNLPLSVDVFGLTSIRLSGPNMHTISFAYVLAFAGVWAMAHRRFLWLLAIWPLMFTIGAKGASILLAMAMVAVLMVRVVGSKMAWKALLALLTLYAVVTFLFGQMHNDYHILGLTGGFKGFLGNPVGHGLGVGGNLAQQGVEWDDIVNYGANMGLESSIGVMLYQIGWLTFVWLAIAVMVVKRMWDNAERQKHASAFALPAGFMVVLVNLIFQEEAMAPLAVGLYAIVGGVQFAQRNTEDAPQVEAKSQ